jgi:hypothetical protein
MSKRKKHLQAEIGTFLKQYQRKAHAGHDPNDRGYDRDFEKKVKAMSPEELNELMDGEEETGITIATENSWFAGETIPGIRFYLNDPVSVVAGQHIGKAGSVIALLRLKPEPEYLIEMGSGEGDIKVFQSRLESSDT